MHDVISGDLSAYFPDPFDGVTADMTPQEVMDHVDQAFNDIPAEQKLGFVVALHNNILQAFQDRLQHLEHTLAMHLYSANQFVPAQHDNTEPQPDTEGETPYNGAYL